MLVKTAEKVLDVQSLNIQPSEGEKLFSANYVLDAYFKGKDDGHKEAQDAFIKIIEVNVRKAGHNTAEVFSFMATLSIQPLEALLKLSTYNCLEVLIAVKEEDFLDEKFLKVYDFVSELEKKVNDELYNITFSFIDSSDELNEDLILSDGFHKRSPR